MKLSTNIINKTLHSHGFAFGIFTVLFSFVFFAGGFVVANGQTLSPSDSHVVNLYIDGQETTAPTRASTVKEFLANAKVTLNEGDLVEPSINSEITSDNYRVTVYRAKPVTIIDGTSVSKVLTPEESPQLIAKKAGITVYPEDKLALTSANNFVDEQIIGEKLTIDRATPATVSLYGTPAATYRTHSSTVGDLLKEKGIVPEPGATVSPAAETPLTANMAIFISKYGKQVVTADESIPFSVQSSPDPSQPVGKVTVTTAGKNGKKQVIYELTLRDGREVGRTKLQEVITEQPQVQIQTKGTKVPTVAGNRQDWMRAAGINEADFYAVDFIIGHESGWRPGALNPAGCAGLGQACPGSKLSAACPSWQTDPVCQLQFFSRYAGRYGGWQGALNAWNAKGWW